MADTEPEADREQTRGIPTDPAELEKWKAEFTDDIMAGEPGGVGVPWRAR